MNIAMIELRDILHGGRLPDTLLHEFACRCAEYALGFMKKPDPRSIAAIAAKREWMRGEITSKKLTDAENAAWVAIRPVAIHAAWGMVAAAQAASHNAVQSARNAAWNAAEIAAKDAAWSDLMEIMIALIAENGR